MAAKLPRGLARFNGRVTNRVQGTWAWLLPPWVVVCHRGRHSGRRYRTPVNGYRRGSRLAIVVLYGPESDWVQNVLAGSAEIVRAGRTHPLTAARLVSPGDRSLPAPARLFGRVSGVVLVGELGPPAAGFGRGPAASSGRR